MIRYYYDDVVNINLIISHTVYLKTDILPISLSVRIWPFHSHRRRVRPRAGFDSRMGNMLFASPSIKVKMITRPLLFNVNERVLS